MPTKPVAKKPIPGKPHTVKPAQKNVFQKKPAPDKTKGLRPLKETPQASLVQKKPAPDKVENLAKEYLAELKEVDVTFEKGTAVLEKYRAKYSELASYIREIVPGERRIEIRQRLEGEDINLHLFAVFGLPLNRINAIANQRTGPGKMKYNTTHPAACINHRKISAPMSFGDFVPSEIGLEASPVAFPVTCFTPHVSY